MHFNVVVDRFGGRFGALGATFGCEIAAFWLPWASPGDLGALRAHFVSIWHRFGRARVQFGRAGAQFWRVVTQFGRVKNYNMQKT